MRFGFAMIVALVVAQVAQGEDTVENPRFCSPSGEYCVVVRSYPRIGDFDRMSSEEYWRVDPIEAWLDEYPKETLATPPPPEPVRAAAYRFWPPGNTELLYEFTPEWPYTQLVDDDGFVTSYERVRCDKKATLLTIRSSSGAIVRTLKVADVFTRHDQFWLCVGGEDQVRWSLGSALQAKVLVTDTTWDDPKSRFATIEIDSATGDVLSSMRDLCPDAVRVEAEPGALVLSAVHRETPEYPVVAMKARISGGVGAEVVVGRDGNVETVKITKPLPFGIDESVRDALLRWTFPPQPEPWTGTIAFRFEIIRNPVIETPVIRCHGSR